MSVFHRLLNRERLIGVQRVVAWTGLLASVSGAALVILPVPSPIAFLTLLAFACLGPGAACVCHVRLGDPVAAWALVLMLSLSVSTLCAATLAWTSLWQPGWGLVTLAGLSASSCATALMARPRSTPPPPTHGLTVMLPLIRGGEKAAALEKLSGDATTILPRITDNTDATTTIPRVTEATESTDATTVIPRITEAADATSVIPRITDTADVTTIIPRIAEATAVIPRITDTAGAVTVSLTDNPPPFLPRFVDPGSNQAPEAGPAFGRDVPSHRRRVRLRPDTLTALLGLVAVAGVWAFSLSRARIAEVDDFGLFSAMHPAFYLSILGCVLGFLLEIARDKPRGWVLSGHTVLLLIVMHATVPILLSEPEYAWTYKHLGVIDLIETGRPLTNPYDVYQQWPAFFALVAQLTAASGLSELRVASWAPVFFGLANLVPMYAIARVLSSDRRVPFLVAFVFSAINWVAQDYLAPQALAYLLCLGTVLVMLRWLRRDPTPPRRSPQRLTKMWSWVQTGMGQLPYTSSRARRFALVTLYIVYTAVTVSHQLSPYLIAMSAAMLVLFRLVQPIQIVPIFGVIAVLQLVPHYRLVESLGLFDGFNLFANAQPLAPTQGAVSDGRIFSVQMVQLLALTVWATAALVVVANRRRLGPYAVPAALAAGPFAMLLGNSYGGEAVFRVFLFSSPWCAYLIASGLLRLRLDRRLGIALATPVLTAATLVAIQGEHGQLMVNMFTPAEVRAAQYLYTNVPKGAAVVMAGVNFPDRINGRYTDVLGAVGATDTLLPDSSSEGAVVLGDAMNQADLDAINSYFQQYSVPVYLVLSRSQANAASYFGHFPDGRLTQLRTLLESSSRWKVWYANEDTQIYLYLPRSPRL